MAVEQISNGTKMPHSFVISFTCDQCFGAFNKINKIFSFCCTTDGNKNDTLKGKELQEVTGI